MFRPTFFLIGLTIVLSAADETAQRDGKLLPIFQVVRFPNDACSGTTRNGTCYTAEECSSKSGVNEGSCASGFGVCCVITLGCGGSSSNNNSYIVQASTTSAPATPCVYDICPCSTDICRIRYDFTTHTLADAGAGTSAATGSLLQNGGTGDCSTDQFSITSPGAWGSPTICGTNTGQHMILDSDGSSCQRVSVNLGTSTSTTRSWDIYVTQYTCGQEDTAGSPGCLQYYTGTTGTFANYGWPTTNTATATATTSVHLSNQNYQICIRRSSGYCYICYTAFNGIATSASFGLSNGATIAAMDHSELQSNCQTDFITIPDGTTIAIAATTTPAVSASSSRYCGRHLNPAVDQLAEVSVCSRTYPFRVSVYTDENEICTAANTITCEADIVIAGHPGGITGFAINYVQSAC